MTGSAPVLAVGADIEMMPEEPEAQAQNSIPRSIKINLDVVEGDRLNPEQA